MPLRREALVAEPGTSVPGMPGLFAGGDALIVSNITLSADMKHGRRPDFSRSAPPEEAKRLYDYFVSQVEKQPVGRVGTPMDIADMVLYLCSDKAGFITGENICIDGGMTRQMIYHGDFGWTLQPGDAP